jgi:putative membrane protein
MTNFKEANLYFSAERTMLSWQRSALSFVALGFGLERYAFMKNADLPNQINHIHYLISECVGLSLILVGTFIAFKSAAHFKSFLSSLSLDDLPTNYFVTMGPIAGYTISMGGLFLMLWILLGMFN